MKPIEYYKVKLCKKDRFYNSVNKGFIFYVRKDDVLRVGRYLCSFPQRGCFHSIYDFFGNRNYLPKDCGYKGFYYFHSLMIIKD